MTDNALDVATVEAPEVTAAAQQIFLGKLASAGENGQVSIFTLPDELKWLDCFTAGELVEFFTEVLIELERALASGDLSEVVSELEAWKATAEINADADMVAGIEAGRREIEDGEVASLKEIQQELGDL